jgi:hypothetical protein
MLAERLLFDIDSGAQEHVGGASAVAQRQLFLDHVNAAADMKKVASLIISI